ncbi:hypothetical protein, partial [Streptomyces microflavus]
MPSGTRGRPFHVTHHSTDVRKHSTISWDHRIVGRLRRHSDRTSFREGPAAVALVHAGSAGG